MPDERDDAPTERYSPGSDETQAFPADDAGSESTRRLPAQPPPPPPPAPTVPMRAAGPPGGPGGGRAIAYALFLLAGLALGFVLAEVLGGAPAGVPSEDLVLYETSGSTFPVDGAAFTESTYDEQRGECSKDRLKQFLRSDPRRFQAWVELQEISEDEFDGFVDRLETRILEAPTSVTNHGCFAEGDGPCPFAIQSVLARGTPVWWDPVSQRIVAKCRCSNPLKGPKCPPNCEDQPPPTPTTPPPTTEPPRTATPPPQTDPPVTDPPITAPPTDPPSTDPPITAPPTDPPLTERPVL